MSGGYSRKGTAHANRIHRDIDAANKAAAEARYAADQPHRDRAARIATALKEAAAVDASDLIVGYYALDRRGRSGRIIRVNNTTVALKDSEALLWRVNHTDVIAVRQEQK